MGDDAATLRRLQTAALGPCRTPVGKTGRPREGASQRPWRGRPRRSRSWVALSLSRGELHVHTLWNHFAFPLEHCESFTTIHFGRAAGWGDRPDVIGEEEGDVDGVLRLHGMGYYVHAFHALDLAYPYAKSRRKRKGDSRLMEWMSSDISRVAWGGRWTVYLG